MKTDETRILVADIADRLEYESKHTEDNRETHYTAAKLLRAFNEIFAPTWHDVEYAEECRRARIEDRRMGVPWLGDDGL